MQSINHAILIKDHVLFFNGSAIVISVAYYLEDHSHSILLLLNPANLLEFTGYTYLTGWIASVATPAADKVLVRSMPSQNMIIGEPCGNGVKITTLQFKVKDNINENSVSTEISFDSLLISPAGTVREFSTAPGAPLRLYLRQAAK